MALPSYSLQFIWVLSDPRWGIQVKPYFFVFWVGLGIRALVKSLEKIRVIGDKIGS